VVVTLSGQIYLNNTYDAKPKLIAVAGAEYSYAAFRDLVHSALNTGSFTCGAEKPDGLGQRCYLMDEAGFLVVHPDYDAFNEGPSCTCPDCPMPKSSFVGEKEPELAQVMMDFRYLIRADRRDSVAKVDTVNYQVNVKRLPKDGVSVSGYVNGKTQAEYYIVKLQQTNLVLIMMDSWIKTSKSFECGALSSTCPDVVLPRSDPYAGDDICRPDLSFYYKNASVLLQGGVATTDLTNLAIIQRTDMCAVEVPTSVGDFLPAIIGVVIAGAVCVICVKFVSMVIEDGKED